MIGQTISHYTILEKLGEGGMGVVYKAEDVTLKRTVALKFLPPHVSASASDKARFLLEAQAAAALNHPNICTIYGIEETQGHSFIAMEFVDGQTLREKRSSITLSKAIDIGIQVAEGLSAAHEKGIVHRDIKPENIMLRKDGLVQIMDFGLAKLRASRASRLTKEGSTVGTAGYMSPEQVQGQETDHRSDIFSMGVLLHELFTGELPFKGVHETALLYEIVNVDPAPMSSVRPEIDPELDRIVLECLQKEPDERYNSVKDIAKDLKRFKRESSKQRMSRTMSVRPVGSAVSRAGAPAAPLSEPGRAGASVREMASWGLAAAGFGLALFLLLRSASPDPAGRQLVRSSIVTPDSVYIHAFGAGLGPPVLSPDGRTGAFPGVTPNGTPAVYVRALDEAESRLLPETQGGSMPFWSPDGKIIGFFAGGKIKKIDIAGGSPTTITPQAANARGATWAADGTIVFTPDFQTGLFRVPADGKGTVERLTTLDSTRHEGSHRWPVFLPDGKHILFMVRTASESGDAEGDAVFVTSLDGSEKKMLVQSSFNAAYANGHLLFARSGVLLAQKFDAERLELEGDPVKLQEGLLTDVSYNVAVFSASESGALIYLTGQALAGARPLLVDRTGTVTRAIEDRNEQDFPRFSPSGKELALYVYDTRSRRSNVWVYDLRTSIRRRVSMRPSGDFFPVWSPDGSRIFFASGGISHASTYVQSAVRSGGEELVTSLSTANIPRDVSPDGAMLLFETDSDSGSKTDLWLIPVAGADRTPVPFQRTKFDDKNGRISRDGRWVAYVSDESGEDEVYLKPFADPASDGVKLTSGGGTDPLWGPTSDELVYVNARREVVSARLRFSGAAGEIAGSERLFVLPPFTLSYDLSPDGTTFAITRSLEMQKFPPLSLVTNWERLLTQE